MENIITTISITGTIRTAMGQSGATRCQMISSWAGSGVVLIPKYTNKNGDPWSGSVVVDSQNTAGFGKGAIVAIMTKPSANDGKEEQFLWYSQNGGKTFKPYGEEPVLPNPDTVDSETESDLG